MALSPFEDKNHQPNDDELSAMLASKAGLWKQLVSEVFRLYAPVEQLWNYGGTKYGWSMRLKRKDRTVLYLIPQVGYFLVGIVLGERAVKAAHQCGVPQAVLDMIDAARPYAEGRGIRLPINDNEDVEVILKLTAVKMAP